MWDWARLGWFSLGEPEQATILSEIKPCQLQMSFISSVKARCVCLWSAWHAADLWWHTLRSGHLTEGFIHDAAQGWVGSEECAAAEPAEHGYLAAMPWLSPCSSRQHPWGAGSGPQPPHNPQLPAQPISLSASKPARKIHQSTLLETLWGIGRGASDWQFMKLWDCSCSGMGHLSGTWAREWSFQGVWGGSTNSRVGILETLLR